VIGKGIRTDFTIARRGANPLCASRDGSVSKGAKFTIELAKYRSVFPSFYFRGYEWFAELNQVICVEEIDDFVDYQIGDFATFATS